MTAGTGAEATQTAIRGDEKPASPARQPSSEDAPWRTLNLTLDPGIFRVVVAHNLASLRRPYLAFMVRTDFCLHADELEAARENLALLRANARAWRLAFTTPPEALALLGM
jgi:hypothetical protein